MSLTPPIEVRPTIFFEHYHSFFFFFQSLPATCKTLGTLSNPTCVCTNSGPCLMTHECPVFAGWCGSQVEPPPTCYRHILEAQKWFISKMSRRGMRVEDIRHQLIRSNYKCIGRVVCKRPSNTIACVIDNCCSREVASLLPHFTKRRVHTKKMRLLQVAVIPPSMCSFI